MSGLDNTMVSTSIQERFAAQARETPDAVALSSGGLRLSYRELDERANRLAHRLLGLGIRPEDPVAVLMERSPDVVVAILAALKAGACYLPLHSAYPLERMQQIMDRSGARVLLTDRVMRERGLPRGRWVIEPATDVETAGLPGTDPEVAGHPDQLAYIIHTSGSTGEPKGVAVSHLGVLRFAEDSCWDGEAHRRVLSVAPYAFGVSTYELWAPLLRGGQIVVAPPGDLDIGVLRRLITEEEITALHLTAGLFRVVAEEAPEIFAGVHEVLTGGDVIAPTAVQRVLQACPGTVVRAMYGATEMSSFGVHTPLTAPFEPNGAVPVGRPMDTVVARLLDERLDPVPDGAVGELYISGERLARGYHGRPDLTAERFVADPYGRPGTRMYRTGDLMRRVRRGLFEFVARSGDQVKIRGYRVEPGEVEHTLAKLPGVVHAAVVVQETEPGERRLVAYIVPASPDTDLTALRGAAARVLPEYMLPAAFVALAALPLTPNGKLDRASLPLPAVSVPETDGQAPLSARQAALCSLFAEVLRVARVGIDDDFFDLNGQSLQAIRLAGRIESVLGTRVSAGDIFNHPTVAELDAHLGQLSEVAR
jgi:amino acid adenylation domain-containing protein